VNTVTGNGGPGGVSPAQGRSTFQAAEPIHAMIYFTPHFLPAYEAVGLRGRRMGYFASRAAAMGPVPADVVIATFFNFNPDVVRRAIPDAWALARPEAILGARLNAVDTSLREGLGGPGRQRRGSGGGRAGHGRGAGRRPVAARPGAVRGACRAPLARRAAPGPVARADAAA